MTHARMANNSTGVVRGTMRRFATILRKRVKKAPARKGKKLVRTQGLFPYLAGIALAAGLALWAAWQFEIKKPDHSALLAAPGVVSWHALAKVNYIRINDKTTLQFDDGISALDGKMVKLRGYVTALDPTRDQRHLFGERPVRYSFDPITVFGRFWIRHDGDSGFFYRMVDARPVPQHG